MSIFDKKIKKTWSLKVSGTEEVKVRYDKVVEGLKKIDPDLSFKIENLLEEQLEQIVIKGEKELIKIEKDNVEKQKNDNQPKETNE
jgi:hypothetical protein